MRFNKRKTITIGVAAAVVLAIIAIVRFGREDDDEAKIRRVIEQLAKLTEEENAQEIEKLFAPDFSGADISSDVRADMRRGFQNVEDLNVDILAVELYVDRADFARAMVLYDISGSIVGTAAYNRIPFRGIFRDAAKTPVETVYAEFSHVDGKWLLKYAMWAGENIAESLPDFPETRKLFEEQGYRF